jgi:hypothetical protein
MTDADKDIAMQSANGVPPQTREHTIDAETGIWPRSEWGSECQRGFVSNDRFATRGDRVIKRTNRSTTRKWRKLNHQEQGDVAG